MDPKTDALIGSEFRELIRDIGTTDGAGGVVVNGHAGEVGNLTHEERRTVIQWSRETIDHAKIHVLLVSGLEVYTTREAIRQAKQARDVGVGALLVLPTL